MALLINSRQIPHPRHIKWNKGDSKHVMSAWGRDSESNGSCAARSTQIQAAVTRNLMQIYQEKSCGQEWDDGINAYVERSKSPATNGHQSCRTDDREGRVEDEATVTPRLKSKGIKVRAKYKAQPESFIH